MMSPLVLNITKQNFFKSHSSKRPRENDAPFATIATKKRKFGVGKPLRISSKSKSNLSKLNIVSSISSITNSSKETSVSKLHVSAVDTTTRQNTYNKTFKAPRHQVTFNDSIETFDKRENDNRKEKSIPPQNENPKPFYSSLFSKAPITPDITRSDVKSNTADVFSTKSFKDLNIAPQIVANLEKLGCTAMTMVQHLGIPLIFEGKDALIKSQTGSGKTLSYAVPIVQDLMQRTPKIERTQGLYALIIVPTRELAIQTYQWMEKLCKACVWIVPGYLIGGEKKKSEKNRLRKGINILVATPGRLTDHINNTNCLSLQRIQYLVLDEADRMLEMGYEKSIKGILYALNEVEGEDHRRQTILLSATLTTAVEKLAGMSLKNPEIIDLTSTDADGKLSSEALATPRNLSHYFMLIPPKLRLVALASFILQKCKFTEEKKMMIFMTTQDMVDYHTSLFSMIVSRIGRKRDTESSNLEREADSVFSEAKFKGSRKKKVTTKDDSDEEIDIVRENDIHLFKLHGNMSQPERTAVFKSFREASSGVLLTTDVASRGLDLPKVNWIVQYNAACSAAEYVHRVGRTARCSAKGSAVLFINPTESTYISMLEAQGIKFNDIKVDDVLKTLTNKTLYHKHVERIPTTMESAATFLQNEFEDIIAEDSDMQHMALQGYVSFLRSYAAIPRNLREYFCFKLLHLGHYAKSFALRETPAVLGTRGLQHKKRDFRPKDEKEREYAVRPKPKFSRSDELFAKKTVVSEFDSGFEGIDQQQEKKLRKKKVLSAKNSNRPSKFGKNKKY